MPGQTQEQVEKRGGAVGGRAPVEVITEAKGLMEDIKDEKVSGLSKAVIGFVTPTITYTSLSGEYKDQEFAPPDPQTLSNVNNRTPLGAFYGQTPYSDATWLLFANPLTMFLVGLGVGAYEAKLTAKKRVSDSIDAAALKEENEKLKGALDELKKYAQQTETPGQMGGRYDDVSRRVAAYDHLVRQLLRRGVEGEVETHFRSGDNFVYDNRGLPESQTRLERFN